MPLPSDFNGTPPDSDDEDSAEGSAASSPRPLAGLAASLDWLSAARFFLAALASACLRSASSLACCLFSLAFYFFLARLLRFASALLLSCSS